MKREPTNEELMLLTALQWYATAVYPDDGSGRPPDAFQRIAKDAIKQFHDGLAIKRQEAKCTNE